MYRAKKHGNRCKLQRKFLFLWITIGYLENYKDMHLVTGRTQLLLVFTNSEY